ncbi:MAG: hypothetical protein CR986_02565 [Ignavibacteriae bacterium]|nr:MAG: hypothetical protein CR986_02565 [Ignavibacteriota bacterium]
MKKIISIIALFVLVQTLFAQKQLEKTLSGYVNPDELVSIAEYTPFDKAIEALSKISERTNGKRIISTAGLTSPIGVEINKINFMKALVIIVQYNGLEFEEKERVIVVRKKIDDAEGLTADNYASLDTREVKISAIFFEADVQKMRERGINWQWLFSNSGIKVGPKLRAFTETKKQGNNSNSNSNSGGSAALQKPLEFLTPIVSEFNVGDWSGTVEAAFKYFEAENLGEVIARPKVTVRDKMKGRIQIGSDISIKQKDFSGNIIDKFYSTGTIIEVSPHIYNEDNQDYILLKVEAERSSAIPGEITTEIKKTQVATDLLMLSGEEKVIGGLFINEEINVRQGIPFLKDLPWWVFGIRYLTGYDKVQQTKKEVIIMLHVELVPTIQERVAQKRNTNLLKKEIVEDHKEFEKFHIKFDDDKMLKNSSGK